MRRRSFLKLIGWTSAWAALAGPGAVSAATGTTARTGSATIAASSSNVRYRAEGGRIYVTPNNGRTWTLHTNLGSMFRVDSIGADKSGTVEATIDYAGRPFTLRLAPDLRWWLTA
jgi:hypothetical protein